MTIGRAFPAAARSVREARDFATAALSGTPAEARADVGLMVSELTTNALQHALSSFRLTVDQTPSEICVEVADYGTGSPRLQSVGPDAPYGRGLQIVNLLSTQWGVRDESEFGKTVWFTVALAAENEAGAVASIDSGWASADGVAASYRRHGIAINGRHRFG